MEKTFCDLRLKEVINQVDGKRLGRIIDMLIDTCSGKICGIIVPGEHSKSVFKRNEEIFISWNKICKIGDDVILVKLGDFKKNDCDDKHRDRDKCDRDRDCDRDEHRDRCDRDLDRDDHRDRCDRDCGNCDFFDRCDRDLDMGHKDKNRRGDFRGSKCMSNDDNIKM